MKKPYEIFKDVGDCYEVVVPDPKNDTKNVTIQGEFRGLEYNYDTGIIDVLFWEFGDSSAELYHSGDILAVKPIETPSAEGEMFFVPYKERSVQLGATVDVYRNLHTDNGYSIRCSKTGLVLAHCSTVHLKDAKFHVSESGRQKTIQEKRKRVHAYVRGILVQYNVDIPSYYQEVRYNPYFNCQFTHTDGGIVKETPEVICSGKHVYVSPGTRAFYTDDEVRGSLQLLGYNLDDEDDVSELALNEGYKWDEYKGYWY